MEQSISTSINSTLLMLEEKENTPGYMLTRDDEGKLSRSGVVSMKTPNATFYVMGKMFSLQGGTELRNVKIFTVEERNKSW